MFFDTAGKTSVIAYKVITEEGLKSIMSLLDDLETDMNRKFPGHQVERLYEIRVGDQVYSGPSHSEFQKLYKVKCGADNIRLILQVPDPQRPAGPVTAQATLVLDRTQPSSFFVGCADIHWVNGVSTRFLETLKQLPSRNKILHSSLFEMTLQMLGAFLLTVSAVYITNEVATLIKLREISPVYIFVIVFVISSNLFTFATRGLSLLRKNYYPIVDIVKEPRQRWTFTVAGLIGAAALKSALGYVFSLFL
jgi:hypothetical protein